MVASTRTVTVAGTTLAAEAGVSERPAETWRGRRNRYFVEEAAKVSRFAIAFGAFVHVAMLAILVDGGVAWWRVAACVGLYVVFAVCHRVFVSKRMLEPECVESSLIAINIASQVFVVGTATLTGGLHSPFLPNLVLPATRSSRRQS